MEQFYFYFATHNQSNLLRTTSAILVSFLLKNLKFFDLFVLLLQMDLREFSFSNNSGWLRIHWPAFFIFSFLIKHVLLCLRDTKTLLSSLTLLFANQMEALSSLHHLSKCGLLICFKYATVLQFLLYSAAISPSNFIAVAFCLALEWVNSERSLKHLWFSSLQMGFGNEFSVSKLNAVFHCFLKNLNDFIDLAAFQFSNWNFVICFEFNCDQCGLVKLLN